MNPLRFALLSACAALAACSSIEQYDVWIRGGTVVDGTGAVPFEADVLVHGGEIVHIGAVDARRTQAREIVDASGRVVTPGFIDPHAHGNPLRTGAFRNFIGMGVTTVCLGMDGSSPTRGPLGDWLQAVDNQELGPNIATFSGHGTVRRRAGVGMRTDPGEEDLARMEAIVREDLAAGAFGLTTGLEYEPGRFATEEELARCAVPVAEVDGVVMSHVRTEDDDAVDEAITELLIQCRTAKCAAHLSHAKVVYGRGRERAERVLALLDEARADGLLVTLDVYPYLASYTTIGIVFPDWARPPADWDEVVATRRRELSSYLYDRVMRRNGPEATLFGTGKWAGRTLADVAQELGKAFEDVLIDEIGPSGASGAYFVMHDELQQRLLEDPNCAVSSDGSPTMRHPRGYGAFARVIRELVVEREVLTLEQAVHKMTGLTAEIVGLRKRGRVEVGAAADLLVFDPRAVRDRATFERPFELAEGFDDVLVAGVAVRRSGEFTGRWPGRVLRRGDD